MPPSAFIPSEDADFLFWLDHLTSHLNHGNGVSEPNLVALKAAYADFRAKTSIAESVAAMFKQATADKNASRHAAEALIKSELWRINARVGYNPELASQFGNEGAEHEHSHDLANASPTLTGSDQSGGLVVLGFNKCKSDGVNIYCHRENEVDWMLLARATSSPFVDDRPLQHPGTPELRRYLAVYVFKDKEIGRYSNDVVISCSP